MIDISIIVPVYNVEDYIAECLESVMSQTADVAMECLLVDDCGQDRSMAVAETVISRYCGPIRFRIIRRESNGGLSAARNTGILSAKGRYIYFLDSDDIITPDCIESLYSRSIEQRDVQIITGDFQTFPEKDIYKDISLADKEFPPYSDDVQWIKSIFLDLYPIISWNKLYLRQWVLDNNLLFREGILHEDNHWIALAYPYIRSLAFVNKVTYLYRQREGSITNHPDMVYRKIKNFEKICDEMFARQIKWDLPWGLWVFETLNYLKINCGELGLNDIWKKLNVRILNNTCVPFIVRLAYLNYRYSPIELGKYRFVKLATCIALN